MGPILDPSVHFGHFGPLLAIPASDSDLERGQYPLVAPEKGSYWVRLGVYSGYPTLLIPSRARGSEMDEFRA